MKKSTALVIFILNQNVSRNANLICFCTIYFAMFDIYTVVVFITTLFFSFTAETLQRLNSFALDLLHNMNFYVSCNYCGSI